jgi:hypothetical protein
LWWWWWMRPIRSSPDRILSRNLCAIWGYLGRCRRPQFESKSWGPRLFPLLRGRSINQFADFRSCWLVTHFLQTEDTFSKFQLFNTLSLSLVTLSFNQLNQYQHGKRRW